MSIFLSKKVRLAQEKQEAAEAQRREKQAVRALKDAELRRMQDDQVAALSRLKAAEEEFQKALEEKQHRQQARSMEPKPKKRLPKARTRTSVETPALFKDSRSTLVSLEPGEEDKLTPRSKFEQKTFATVSQTPMSQLREADLTSVLIPEMTSENSDLEEQHYEVSESFSPDFSHPIPIHRYTRKHPAAERLPPPSIPYSTRGGDVLSVHIVGGSNRKQSLDLHRVQNETPAALAREELAAHSRDFSLSRKDVTPRSKLSSKGLLPLMDTRGRGRKNSPGLFEDSPDLSSSPRAQFHVFRDLSLDQVKVDAERRGNVERMRQYALKAKAEFPPIPSERKRVELELIREKAAEFGHQKRFRRVGLQTLVKSVL